jgi:hypothetical protein
MRKLPELTGDTARHVAAGTNHQVRSAIHDDGAVAGGLGGITEAAPGGHREEIIANKGQGKSTKIIGACTE